MLVGHAGGILHEGMTAFNDISVIGNYEEFLQKMGFYLTANRGLEIIDTRGIYLAYTSISDLDLKIYEYQCVLLMNCQSSPNILHEVRYTLKRLRCANLEQSSRLWLLEAIEPWKLFTRIFCNFGGRWPDCVQRTLYYEPCLSHNSPVMLRLHLSEIYIYN